MWQPIDPVPTSCHRQRRYGSEHGVFLVVMLILGLILFFGIHALPMNTGARTAVLDRLGEPAYKVLFGVMSLAGLVVIVWGYQAAVEDNVFIWTPPVWTQHIAVLLMLPALIILVSAYVPSRIRSALKHPMLVAIKVWAFAHLIANGDLVSMILFGAFLAYAVVDRISVKRRAALGPLGAAAGTVWGDVISVVVGSAAFWFFLVYGHAWLFGVAPIPALSWY